MPQATRSLRRVGIFTPIPRSTLCLCLSVVRFFFASFAVMLFLSASLNSVILRSEAAAEHSRRTPCFSIQPPALKGILDGSTIPRSALCLCGEIFWRPVRFFSGSFAVKRFSRRSQRLKPFTRNFPTRPISAYPVSSLWKFLCLSPHPFHPPAPAYAKPRTHAPSAISFVHRLNGQFFLRLAFAFSPHCTKHMELTLAARASTVAPPSQSLSSRQAVPLTCIAGMLVELLRNAQAGAGFVNVI